MSAEAHGNMVKVIWRTFWIMLIVTIVEIIGALTYPADINRMPLNIFFVVMSMIKAIYIVGTFMHLKFEVKHLIITVLIPVILLLYTVSIFFSGRKQLA